MPRSHDLNAETLPTHILIVDDEPAVIRALTRALETWGYEVIPARQGSEAKAIAGEDQQFAAAIVDINLPDIHGLELVRWLKDRQPGIRVVVASGDDNVEAGEGITVLKKPFLLAELKAALAP